MNERLKGPLIACAALVLAWILFHSSGVWESNLVHLTDSNKSSLPTALSPLPVPQIDTSRADSAPAPDPFMTRPEPSKPSGVPVPRSEPKPVAAPPRPWKVVGLVGAGSAVLMQGNRTQVVSPGDRVDSARVVSIGASGVTMQDAGGTFHLAAPR